MTDLLAPTVLTAHLGHWYVGLPVYMGPVVLILAWLRYASWRDRRRAEADRRAREPKR
jgi:hypothetical protein